MQTLLVNAVLAAAVAALDKRILPPCFIYSNLFLGHRKVGDSLLYSGDVQVPLSLLRYTTGDFLFPQEGDLRKMTITRIEAVDNETDGTGGCPEVVSGGVDFGSVRIRFKSWWSADINYRVNIYGALWQ